MSTPEQTGRAALASLHPYPLSRLYAAGWTIHYDGPRSGFLGLTSAGPRRIDIYIRHGQSVTYTAYILAHELGHAIDFTWGTPAGHAQYLKLRGINPSTPWFGCNYCTDFSTPAGDWAEVFARYLTGNHDFYSKVAGAPSAAQLRAIAPLFQPPAG